MNNSVLSIPVANLALAFLPVFAVVYVMGRWHMGARAALHAVSRMLLQLLLVGYVLLYIFRSDSSAVIAGVLAVMLIAASWISMRPVKVARKAKFPLALVSIALGGGVTLLLITQGVLHLEPWFFPRYVVPLGGMIFANSMNAVSLAAERLDFEVEGGAAYVEARRNSMTAALIPITNSLFAVGIVSLPGMMTGQILSGISPLVAARYQIMVMCMIFGSAGLSSACYLTLVRSRVAEFAPGRA